MKRREVKFNMEHSRIFYAFQRNNTHHITCFDHFDAQLIVQVINAQATPPLDMIMG